MDTIGPVTLGELIALIVASAAWSTTATVVAPTLLTHGTWWYRWPNLALWAWWAVMSSIVAAATGLVLAACLALVAATSTAGETARLWVQCAIALIVVAIVAVVSYALGRGEREFRSSRQARHDVETLIATFSSRCEQRTGYQLVILDTNLPIAVSIGGRMPRILLSGGLVERLTVEELNAVIWHERAHVELRHESLVRLAALVAVLVPWAPAARSLARSVHLLTELSADDVASTRAGAVHVAAAMEVLHEAEGNGSLHQRAARTRGLGGSDRHPH